jgi:hypothetical protein
MPEPLTGYHKAGPHGQRPVGASSDPRRWDTDSATAGIDVRRLDSKSDIQVGGALMISGILWIWVAVPIVVWPT